MASPQTTPDGKFCAVHREVKVRRKDMMTVTAIGCWKCSADQLMKKDGVSEDQSTARLVHALAATKGKDNRTEAIKGALTAIRKSQEDREKEHDALQKKFVDLQRENTSLGQKWQDAKALHEEAIQDLEHRDSQLERTLEAMEGLRSEKDEADRAIEELQGRVDTLEKEREAMRAEALDYAKHIKDLEMQLEKIIAKQGLHEKVPNSPVRGDAPSQSLGLEPVVPVSPRAAQRIAAPPRSSPPTVPSEKPNPLNKGGSAFGSFFIRQKSKEKEKEKEKEPESKPMETQDPSSTTTTTNNNNSNKPTPISVTINPNPTVVTFSVPAEEKAATNNKDKDKDDSPKNKREKISIVAHMNNSDRVNFKMYKDDVFQKVMERYLKVKNIDCPLDEVRFVVDNRHSLLPELRPVDFELQDGALINVILPEEYTPPPKDVRKKVA